MLSRVANSIYWMFALRGAGGESSRAFVDVNLQPDSGISPPAPIAEQWSASRLHATGESKALSPHAVSRAECDDRRASIQILDVRSQRNPSSMLVESSRSARENARTVREVISTPVWAELNRFYHLVGATRQQPPSESPYQFCAWVKAASHALAGVADATMSHGEAWHFGRMGRLIERADKTSRIVDVQYYLLLPRPQDVGSTLDVVRWSALLKSADALEMYRREHGRIEADRVAEFLLLNRQFPRSLRFCVVHALDSLREITGSARGTFTNRVEQLLGRLRSELDYASIGDVIDRGLHEFIDDVQGRLNEVGLAIQQQVLHDPAGESLRAGRRVRRGVLRPRHADPRRADSSNRLPLRPARRARTPDRPPPPRATHADAHHELLAARRPAGALRQLAPGPAGKLSGAAGLSGQGRAVRGRGRPDGRADRHQPVRLLHRGQRGALPLRLRVVSGHGARPVSTRRSARGGAAGLARHRRPVAGEDDGLPGRAERAARAGDRVRRSHWSPACRPARRR